MRALVAQTQRWWVIGLVHSLEAVQNLVAGGDHRCGHDALECDVAVQVEEVLLLSIHGVFPLLVLHILALSAYHQPFI